MINRAEILTMIAEVRGRLEELERLVQFGPDFEILTPAGYDDPDIDLVTPAAYAAFRTQGLEEDEDLPVFTPFSGFLQFGSPDPEALCRLSSFELSELHRDTVETAHGLQLTPSGPREEWFTYEFILEAADILKWDWTEWVLKLSFAEPLDSPVQFILDGEGKSERIEFGSVAISEFASFQHLRLTRGAVLQAMAGTPVDRVRLILGTGGMPMPLTLQSFAIYGKRG